MNTTELYNIDLDFNQFLIELKSNDAKAWNWLVAKFRKKLVPFLHKRLSSYPKSALLSKGQFIEEVIEESLYQFLKIFPQGTFSTYGNLEATVVTIAGYKLKEGFARLKKEQKIYFLTTQEFENLEEHKTTLTSSNEIEQIHTIKEKLKQLPNKEKNLLKRYFSGEELQDIAIDLNISAATCRKRKQRILDKLKALVFKSLITLAIIFWI